jgi:hypothetical protein
MKKMKKTAQVDPLTYIYYELRGDLDQTSYELVLRRDLTAEFWITLKQKIENGGLISIAVRGEVTSGKSTVGLAIKAEVNKLIMELGLNKNIDEYKTIVSDLLEWNRAIMNKEDNVCYLIDEWSELGGSGENSTTEASLYQTQADIAAQRYLHKIQCVPRTGTVYDNTSTILLDTIGRDSKKKTTLCRLYVNDPTDPILTPLGTINVYVGDVIEEDYYKRYRKKKFARISLMDREGVRDIRELEASAITLEAYKQLKGISTISEKMPNELITITVKTILQDRKLFYSIVGKVSVENPIRALLGTAYTISKLKRKIADKPMPEQAIKDIKKMIKIMEEKLNGMLKTEQRNVEILEQYNNIQ